MKRRAALLTAILLMACPIGNASAGFLEDYYDAAGAMSSVTPAACASPRACVSRRAGASS